MASPHDPAFERLVVGIRELSDRLELTSVRQHPQPSVRTATIAIECTGELGRHVQNSVAAGEESLRKGAARAVGAGEQRQGAAPRSSKVFESDPPRRASI